MITGEFTSTGASNVFYATRADVEIYGDFVGTVEIHRLSPRGAWVLVDSSDATITGQKLSVVDTASFHVYMLVCDDYTSGTIGYQVTGAHEGPQG